MEQAETEGIADLIDKRDMVLAPQGLPANQLAHPGLEWMWRIYLSQLKAAPSHVAELGLLLEQIADDELDLARAERLEADAGRISARPLGVFIADAVERKLGRARVIASVGDPFALLLAYAEAASGDDALPNISQSACEVLVRLRSVYGGN